VFDGLEMESEDAFKELINGLYHMAVDEAPKTIAEGLLTSIAEKLTMYSLYK
jgi:hypothetical protein